MKMTQLWDRPAGPMRRVAVRRLISMLPGVLILGAMLAPLTVPMTAQAQAWPARPLRIVVPFPAGTATDTVTRILAPALSSALGQPVVVDNRPGADGAIGAQEVARAAPDGYTLLMSTNGFAAVPALRKQPPYEPMKDFSPVSMFGRYSFFLYVNSAVPANTVQELLALAKAQPGALNYATGNPTGIVATGQMVSLAGVSMVQVPYKGEPAGMVDLVANRVQLMFATPTTAGPYVTAGKLRMLATTLPTRSPAFPDVPTMAEAGLPKFSVPSWAALQGPVGMPAEIVERLAREVAAAIRQPDVKDRLERQNFIAGASTPDELRTYIAAQLELYARTLREAGVQPE